MIKNLDNNAGLEARQALFNAIQSGDEKEQEQAFLNFAEAVSNAVEEKAMAQLEHQTTVYTDEQALQVRGLRRAMTSDEKRYFNAVVERGGFEGVSEVFPKTIFEEVFKDLTEEHPLLSRVDMRNTTGLVEYVFANPTEATAFWGPICEDIKQMIINGFETIDVQHSRLSGFVAICKGMLELGPDWLATYIITIMREIMSTALETAIVAGTGKNQPIGMIKQLSGATDSVYPDKPKVALKDFEPKSLAGIRAAMAEAKTDRGQVVMLVNPMTYWLKVFPALAFRTQDGVWVKDVLPTGEPILQSHAVPEDTLVFGVPSNYFMGVSGDVRIDRYDQTLAIEDMELFIAKFYGHGQAKDKNAFFVADISGVAGGTKVALEETKPNTPKKPGE